MTTEKEELQQKMDEEELQRKMDETFKLFDELENQMIAANNRLFDEVRFMVNSLNEKKEGN